MALTPEDVVNQKFTITKFRDGYDLDQVDDFLDTIVEELRQHESEKTELQAANDELQAKVDALTAELEACRAQQSGEQPAAPVAAVPQEADEDVAVEAPAVEAEAPQQSVHQADAVKSSAMLQMALELHDKYVRDGESTRDRLVGDAEAKSAQLVGDAESTAKRLVEEAQQQRADEMSVHTREVEDIKGRIVDLRQFESEYRTTLRSYIQSQLRGLDTVNEPEGAPEGLE